MQAHEKQRLKKFLENQKKAYAKAKLSLKLKKCFLK
jgi:hypothetical protein